MQTNMPGHLAGSSVHMPLLATRLGRAIGYPVVDRTGLDGYYKIDLTWTPEAAGGPEPRPELGVSVFTAVQEQLGLRLVAEKQTGVVLVIDHVEKPSAN